MGIEIGEKDRKGMAEEDKQKDTKDVRVKGLERKKGP
jgi:hypothetical protein